MLKQKEENDAVEILVHKISVGDVEDPDVMVAQPIYEWQQTESGKYVMEKSNPTAKWVRGNNPHTYGHEYKIYGYFTPEEACFWRLKFE